MKTIRIYADIDQIEEQALQQFYTAMNEDYVVRGALMPDVHSGYALPIGAVVATRDTVVPSWVGYDIGCGVAALRTDFKARDIRANSRNIFDTIYERIPVGFAQHSDKREWHTSRYYNYTVETHKKYEDHGRYQLGTLGSGNHFIEIGADEDNCIWIVIHSGSRNLGHSVASHYMRTAAGDNKQIEGNYGLSINTDIGRDYLDDICFCTAYARENREQLVRSVLNILNEITDTYSIIDYNNYVATVHNTIIKRGDMYVHRKGATEAIIGTRAVIPGNMLVGSFIVEGLTPVDSVENLWSCSHGAGRKMSRTIAKKTLSLLEMQAQMETICAKVEMSTLDEAPSAYKDIYEVMSYQKDLVKIVHHVKPIINIKA